MVGMRLGQFERVGGGQINALQSHKGDPATRLQSRSAERVPRALVPNRSSSDNSTSTVTIRPELKISNQHVTQK
jgi:hypothetical protein